MPKSKKATPITVIMSLHISGGWIHTDAIPSFLV